MGQGFPAFSTTRASGAVPGAVPSRPTRRRAAREGEMVERATPVFWPLMRHGAGAGYSCLYSSLSPASGGRSLHSDPLREGYRQCSSSGRFFSAASRCGQVRSVGILARQVGFGSVTTASARSVGGPPGQNLQHLLRGDGQSKAGPGLASATSRRRPRATCGPEPPDPRATAALSGVCRRLLARLSPAPRTPLVLRPRA